MEVYIRTETFKVDKLGEMKNYWSNCNIDRHSENSGWLKKQINLLKNRFTVLSADCQHSEDFFTHAVEFFLSPTVTDE